MKALTPAECVRQAWTCKENAAAFERARLRAVRAGRSGSVGLTLDELAAARDAALRRARAWERQAAGAAEGTR